MKEHFEKQLAIVKTCDGEMIDSLKGCSIYGAYGIGDKVLFFLEQSDIDDSGSDKPSISFSMKTVTERELPELDKEYEFIRMGGTTPGKIPVLKKKVLPSKWWDNFFTNFSGFSIFPM
jgi:hypothetical protein